MRRLAEQFGIPGEIVSIWEDQEGPSLLEVQRKAIEECGLLNGTSLIVSAPSSSGKTFVGEIAAIHSYYQNKKSVFLVPMKAIAEEKYAEFNRKYGSFGINVVISTQDRTEFDSQIIGGWFDIAIVIYEKMNSLLTQNPAILNSCGLVIIDETQVLNDRSRGPALEILLTRLKMERERREGKPQLICLSGVLGDLNGFDAWIGATHCGTSQRPLELHEGVLAPDGTIRYWEFNGGRERTDRLSAVSSVRIPPLTSDAAALEESIQQRLALLCRHFVDQGKKVLVFRKYRKLARETAQVLARELNLPPATDIIRKAGEFEQTHSRELLIECLSRGVAFHTADLEPEVRVVVEEGFRDQNSNLKVVCATSTLAMGVNLPASVVLIPDIMRVDSESSQFHEVPMSVSEYKNMAGRAGRTRFAEDGISILLANNAAQVSRYWSAYVRGRLEPLSPALKDQDLRKVMIGLAASGLVQTWAEMRDLLLGSFTGYRHWNSTDATRRAFGLRVEENARSLLQDQLVEEDSDGRVKVTGLGRLCAATGTEVETFLILRESLENIDPSNWDLWEVLFPCLHGVELRSYVRRLRVYDVSSELGRALEDLNPPRLSSMVEWSSRLLGDGRETEKRILLFFMLRDWIEGVDLREIEARYGRIVGDRYLSGTLQDIAQSMGWLVKSLGRIAAVLEYPNAFVDDMDILGERVIRGVPAEGIAIHKLRVPGLTRPMIKRLIENGYTSLDSILDVPANDFRGVISPRVATRLQEEIIAQVKDSQLRQRREQEVRLSKCGLDPVLVRRIYEAEGTDLEEAVVDLLNAPPLQLGAERIPTQREGEPDIRLAVEQGLLVGSVTASNTNVSDSKCAEIIRSGARWNPDAFVVFGRPGFHELAIRNAPNINRQLGEGKSYKLIPISTLGYLFVFVAEGKLSREGFINILIKDRNLIGVENVLSSREG